jgi:hypothetical protein
VDRLVNIVIGAFTKPYRERPGHPVPSELAFKDITLKLVSEVFGHINPNDKCLSVFDKKTMTHATWIRAFAIANEDCQETIGQLWRYGRYLDPEIAALLSDMEASALSQMLRFFGDIPMGDGNLIALAGVYFPLFGTAMRLAECTERLRKRYGLTQASAAS